MNNGMKNVVRWSILLGLSVTLGGNTPHLTNQESLEQKQISSAYALEGLDSLQIGDRSFDPYSYMPTAQRLKQLSDKVQNKQGSPLQTVRARLVKAEIYLQTRQFQEAIASLDQLENSYPLMADYILLKRAVAQSQSGNAQAAKATWQALLAQYADQPSAAEALYALGQTDKLLQQFPAHPRSQEVILRMLSQAPNRIDLMTHLATYFGDYKQIVPILNRLVASSPNLSAEQWWAIANAYYYNFEFDKAAIAYTRATPNPLTAYNYARSLHRAKRNDAAIAAYNRVVQQFPQSPQAPRALIRLTQLGTPSMAIAACDQIIANYPDTASEALAIKAEILQNQLQSPQAASIARNQLLDKYGNSNEAGELLWQIAKGQAKSGQRGQAIAYIDRLLQNAPNSSSAAEAAFWAGKWATQIGDRNKAKTLFEFTIREHPDSYYAWRSASSLGWQVGSFADARFVNLPLDIPSMRFALPAGSAKLQELYLLGLDQEARSQWQTEIAGKRILNPSELFVDGVLRVAVMDNLKGIRTLESLDWIDVSHAEKEQIKQLKQHPAYIHSLYPFHYWDSILEWSNERKISPALVLGLMRQESRFEAQILSSAGAIGLMQIMPETGSWIASKKGLSTYNLSNPSDNIKFGTWYLDYTHSRYGNNSMLAIASYNAGPGAVADWVSSRPMNDPDDFVNSIPYSETRDYVSKVLGNYWNYLRLYSPSVQQQIAALQSPKP
ncbi:MAG: transglycosylase SLT domain-containing protein [Pseudanabaenaceae cyanobacterium bins.39]|nr:transglycosylase SLT domain-containing protein [Pseudanabaenaceae cyanobacterium bins.39]